MPKVYLFFAIFLFNSLSAAAECGGGAITSSELGKLPKSLREVSGIVKSRTHPGIFWVHNDSGNDPIIYGFRYSLGKVTEVSKITLDIEKKFRSDWEDITIAPGADGSDWLYIADTGNNNFTRVGSKQNPSRILRFKEPKINKSKKIGPRSIEVLNLKLPGQYDIEALTYRAQDKNLYLVSKSLDKSQRADLFSFSPENVSWSKISKKEHKKISPEFIGGLAVGRNDFVTGADFSDDGKRFSLLSQKVINIFNLVNGSIYDVFPRSPSTINISEQHPEGINFISACTLLVTSEDSRAVREITY